MPGLDEDAELPTHFTMTAAADHADLSWMMTFATSEPLKWFCDEANEKIGSLNNTVDELKIGLTALCDGEALPEGEEAERVGRHQRLTRLGGVLRRRGRYLFADWQPDARNH